MTDPKDPAEARRAWLVLLAHELFQTEQSAVDHPLVEARRLGDVPPARALRAVSEHAREALAELEPRMQRRRRPGRALGRAVGAGFSVVRDWFADAMLSAEQSYRATLLGIRHGVDVVELTMAVALDDGDVGLAEWCEGWLARRRPLVEEAGIGLEWFAEHPLLATAPAEPGNPAARGIQAIVRGCRAVAQRLSAITMPAREPLPADVRGAVQ